VVEGECSSKKIGLGLGWLRRTSKENISKKDKRNMKSIIKTVLYLQMAALLVTAALAGPAAGKKELPFRGSFRGLESFAVEPPLLLINGSGTAHATHLGHFTATWDREAFLADGSQTASYHFIAANGDSLFVESIGQADLTLAPDIHVVELGTITGGTGRFAGAMGSFTLERVVVLTGPDSDTVSGSFEGTIVMPKTQ
jgi:hypothetical protein